MFKCLMTADERNKRLKALGYRLVYNYFSPIHNSRFPYATLPLYTGSTCVHNTLAGVEKRILDAEKVRAWQSEN